MDMTLIPFHSVTFFLLLEVAMHSPPNIDLFFSHSNLMHLPSVINQTVTNASLPAILPIADVIYAGIGGCGGGGVQMAGPVQFPEEALSFSSFFFGKKEDTTAHCMN